MPMEARPLARKLRMRRAPVGGLKGYRGEAAGGGPVVAVVTGMGPRLATEGASRLLDAVHVSRVVVVGITGAVDKGARIGSIVVPEVVVDGDTGAEYRPGPLAGFPNKGRMRTSATLTNPEDLAARGEPAVDALDMETAAVAAVCDARGTPWAVVRAVSDAGIDTDVAQLGREDGSADLVAGLRFLLRHPGRIPGLVRLGRDASRAAAAAADAAIRATAG
jgi:adenosylhomocysteine nucleosidase